jgi:predicted amidohydrolase
MKLAAIQLDTVAMEVNSNVHKALHWTRRAFEQGAKYVFLHEGLTADYAPDPMKYGRSLDSVEVFSFSVLAKHYGGYVALGLNEVYKGAPYISCVYLDGNGVIDVYRKSYLWSLPDRDNYIAYIHGYRQELGMIGHGDGTRNIRVGDLLIGSIICADGNTPVAWETFRKDPPDIVFYQNNRGNVDEPRNPDFAREINRPMVCTNRVGYSYYHFQHGGTRFIRRDGTIAVAANGDGNEQAIYAHWEDL